MTDVCRGLALDRASAVVQPALASGRSPRRGRADGAARCEQDLILHIDRNNVSMVEAAGVEI